MSVAGHQQLQRVVVRMLFDPDFVARVYRDPVAATAELQLTTAQRLWLVRPDRRSWTIDRARRSRTLSGLVLEYPATTAISVGLETNVAETFHRFFSSSEFHGCIQGRGSLALAFADYVSATFADRRSIVALAGLERRVAQLRRAILVAPPVQHVVLTDRCVPFDAPAGATAVYETAIARAAFVGGPVALLANPEGASFEEVSANEREFLLAERQDDGSIGLAGGSEELVRLLAAAAHPLPLEELWSVAQNLGCDPTEAVELVAELVADGLLALG